MVERNRQFHGTEIRLTYAELECLTDVSVRYWDFLLTDDAPCYRDSSAGAIMAAGLFLLADVLDDEAKAAHYRASARAILDGLIAGYTTFDHPQAEGLLTQGPRHIAHGYCDNLLAYGADFF